MTRGIDRAFLTVTAWPEGADRNERADLLCREAGLDLHTMRLRAAQSPPAIIGEFSPEIAQRAVRALVDAGGHGLAPTLGDLQELGATRKIRDLAISDGALKVDLWRGDSESIDAGAIDVIVRARISEKLAIAGPSPEVESLTNTLMNPCYGPAYALGGAAGVALAFSGVYVDGASRPETRQRVADKIDIHTRDRLVYQVDADKFGFGVLGEKRSHGDKSNTDRLCERLHEAAPEAVIDPWFSLWTPPASHRRLRLPGALINRDDPSFAFYSRWIALVYRSLTGPGAVLPGGR